MILSDKLTYSNGKFSSITVLDGEPLKEMVSNYVDNAENTISRLRTQLAELKKETYKDEELSKLTKQLERMREDYYRGFPISKENYENINVWIKEHEKVCKVGHGCGGGKYTYEFVPTGIGTFGRVVCGSCKEKIEFDDV